MNLQAAIYGMRTCFLYPMKIGLALALVALVSGCALTTPVQRRIEGYSKVVKDDSPAGSHVEKQWGQAAYIPLLFITVPIDVATFPIQVFFVPCIWSFYDVHFCDAGPHDSPMVNGLARHSDEPPRAVAVALAAPRGRRR
jgi:hypothetical protein